MTSQRDAIHAINLEINALEREQSVKNFRGEYHDIPSQLNALQLRKLAIANPTENPAVIEQRWNEAQAYRVKWGHNP